MTDAELAKYLNLSPAHASIIIPKITPGQRALYEKMAQVETELALWQEGLGPKPEGVLIDTVRSTRRRRAWR